MSEQFKSEAALREQLANKTDAELVEYVWEAFKVTGCEELGLTRENFDEHGRTIEQVFQGWVDYLGSSVEAALTMIGFAQAE